MEYFPWQMRLLFLCNTLPTLKGLNRVVTWNSPKEAESTYSEHCGYTN